MNHGATIVYDYDTPGVTVACASESMGQCGFKLGTANFPKRPWLGKAH